MSVCIVALSIINTNSGECKLKANPKVYVHMRRGSRQNCEVVSNGHEMFFQASF